jgi:hypothetical protein
MKYLTLIHKIEPSMNLEMRGVTKSKIPDLAWIVDRITRRGTVFPPKDAPTSFADRDLRRPRFRNDRRL